MPKKSFKRKTPYVRKRRFNRKRKATNFRRKSPGSVMGSPRGMGITFPKNLYTVLKYAQFTSLTSASLLNPGIQTYRLNGIFDPDQTGTGAQPRYMDTLLGNNASTAPYRNYRVHACKWKVMFTDYTQSVGGCGRVATIVRRSTVTSPSTLDEASMWPGAKVRMLGNYAGNMSNVTVKGFNKIKYVLGHKDLTDVDGTAAAYNATPSEEVYLDIMFETYDSTSRAIRAWIVLEYFCQLYTQADVADS